MKKFEPIVTIIIPVRNSSRTLRTTFEYLLDIDYPKDKMEILLADGDSSDDTIDIIKDCSKTHSYIKLIQILGCKSPGQARNAALKEVTGEYVLFTDGDCAPNKDWIYQSVAPFEKDPKIGGVGGEILTLRVEEDNFTEMYCEEVHFLSPRGRCGVTESGYMPAIKKGIPHEVNGGDNCPFFATANFTVSKKAIDAIGGQFWDEPTGEDIDFSLRIMEAGFLLYYQKEAVIKHMHRVDINSLKRQYYKYGYGHPLLINKHHKKQILEFYIQIWKGIYFTIPFPKKGIIHIGSFHLMKIGSLKIIFGIVVYLLFKKFHWQFWLINADIVLYLLYLIIIGTAWFAFQYFMPVLKLKPLRKFLKFAKIRYATNTAFYKGAVAGQKKFNTICIESSW